MNRPNYSGTLTLACLVMQVTLEFAPVSKEAASLGRSLIMAVEAVGFCLLHLTWHVLSGGADSPEDAKKQQVGE